MWEFTAEKADRLDRALRVQGLAGAEWLSRASWDWLVENGQVFVNGRKCVKSGQELTPGALVKITLPGGVGRLGLFPSEERAPMLWASEGLALFNKPCGLSTVPLFPWDHSAFANQVAATLEAEGLLPSTAFAALSAPPQLEGGLLQRLDRDTSGVLLAALDEPTKAKLRQLLSNGGVEKTYLAIAAAPVEGAFAFRLHGQGGAKVQAKKIGTEGEQCVLTVEAVSRSSRGALLRVRTRHGARHVVRAGLALFGAPLVGDKTYGGPPVAPFHQLHALCLRAVNPKDFSLSEKVTAPIPETFLDSLRALGLNYPG